MFSQIKSCGKDVPPYQFQDYVKGKEPEEKGFVKVSTLPNASFTEVTQQ